ncbi:MAG: hypothetical protein ABSD42_14190 [Candidatus Bathyarchaeia archaeon]
MICSIHSRVQKQLDLFDVDAGGLTLVEPLDYLSFLKLESKAMLVLSDSDEVPRLLGRTDIFEHFKITFDEEKLEIIFETANGMK